MGDKLKEYRRGRADGLLLALAVVREGGVKALEKEILMKGRMGVDTSLTMKELDVASEKIKEVAIETLRIASVSILHDMFGFGQSRCQKFMGAFDKMTDYLKNGWTSWMEVIDHIKEDLNLEMPDTWLQKLDVGGKYGHPDPEDIYDRQDLIDPEMWNAMLKELHFTEKQMTKERYQIFDNHGLPILQYEGIWSKIQMYDVLNGILIARDHLGWKETEKKNENH